MPGVSPQGVFLSYRREDAGPYARSLQLQLAQRMPGVPIFMDLDSIEAGLDFAEVIEDAVKSCAVLVALIGRRWATLTDDEGRPRLNNPDDYVRFEVKAALERGVRVIPVLIDDAKPLRQRDLPAELHKLARLNARKLSYDRYQDDVDRLLDLIQRVLAIGRAARLLADAERIANSITSTSLKVSALSDIAKTLAATDPGRAESIANSITDEYSKGSALSGIARALAATDPGRAARLLADAERNANSITDEHRKAETLRRIAQALTATYL